MELGHWLTRSGLTYPEVSSKVYYITILEGLVYFLGVFCGLNILFKIPVIFKSYLICYQCPILLHKIS